MRTHPAAPAHRILRTLGAVALATGLGLGLSACGSGSPIDNIVGGAVDEGVRSLSTTASGLVDEALGGAGVTLDGEVPSGFPSEVPLAAGSVLGGGAGPNSSGWVVQLRLESVQDFEDARTALADAGYTEAGVNVDDTSGFGTFTSDAYRVVVVVSTDTGSGEVTANYVVTPV